MVTQFHTEKSLILFIYFFLMENATSLAYENVTFCMKRMLQVLNKEMIGDNARCSEWG